MRRKPTIRSSCGNFATAIILLLAISMLLAKSAISAQEIASPPVDYVVVKAQEHEVVVGSIATFAEERDAKFLFDVEGREYSFFGWQALFQLIASVTGETVKFSEVNNELYHQLTTSCFSAKSYRLC